MKKLTLDLDAIQVESFETEAGVHRVGTVDAHSDDSAMTQCFGTECNSDQCVEGGGGAGANTCSCNAQTCVTTCYREQSCGGTCLHSSPCDCPLTDVISCVAACLTDHSYHAPC